MSVTCIRLRVHPSTGSGGPKAAMFPSAGAGGVAYGGGCGPSAVTTACAACALSATPVMPLPSRQVVIVITAA